MPILSIPIKTPHSRLPALPQLYTLYLDALLNQLPNLLMSKEQKSPQSNNDDKKTSFLDEPEIEVMPGVYMTQYGKNKQTTAQANPVTDVQNDLAELESDKESLEQEVCLLKTIYLFC